VILFACSPDPPPPTPRPPRAAPLPLEVFFEIRRLELADVGGRPLRALVTEEGPEGARARELPLDGGPAPPPFATGAAESRALALLADGGDALIELASPGSRTTLALRRRSGVVQPLRPPALGRDYPLGTLADGRALLLRHVPDDGAPERLDEVDVRDLRRRTLAIAPEGYRIAAATSEGPRLALVRDLDPGSSEVLVQEGDAGNARLLLPSGADGRFRPQAFLDRGRALLLLADDDGDDFQLERIEVTSGRRSRFGTLPCPPTAARTDRAGGFRIELRCAGRREVRLLAGDAEARTLPRPPDGTRVLDAILLPGLELGALLAGGERWPADLAAIERALELRPLTLSLPARVRPDSLPGSTPLPLASAGHQLPAELWRPATPIRAGLLWIEDDDAPPRFGELQPLIAALASRGIATLRIRGRGADGFGRGLRLAARDADAARADLHAALAALRASLPAGAPLATLAGAARWTTVLEEARAETAPSIVYAATLARDPFASSAELFDPASGGVRIGPELAAELVRVLRAPR
jgi:hypothetical protein